MSGFVSIETFSVTLAAGSNQTYTLTKSQDIDNCIPFFSKRISTVGSDPGLWTEQAVDVYFSSTDTVNFETTTTTTRAIVVECSVVEFDGTNVEVQSGTFTIPANSTSDTVSAPGEFTAVTATGDTFLTHAHKIAASGGAADAFSYINVGPRLTATDTMTFTRETGSGAAEATGHWWLAECTDGSFDVQHVEITNTTGTGTVTLSPTVTMAKTFLLGGIQEGSADDNADSTMMIELTANNTITATREEATGTTIWAGCAVTFTDNSNVYRGTITGQGATADSGNVAIGATVDLTRSMVHNAGTTGSINHNKFPGSADTDVPDSQCAWSFVNSTNVKVQHSTNGGEADNDLSWEVIEWDAGAAPASRRVMVIS